MMMKKKVLIGISIIYIFFLIFIFFIKNRGSVLSNASFKEYVSMMCNFIPFKTIIDYLVAIKDQRMNILIPLSNLGGNFILFMPFAYIMHSFTKIKERYFLLITFIIILFIEIMQLLTRSGSFDIDDFILNMLGAGIVYLICMKMQKPVNHEYN